MECMMLFVEDETVAEETIDGVFPMEFRKHCQILDKTFDEYVDLSPEDTIPDLSKILLRPQVDSEQQCASTSTEHIAASVMVASGSEDHENGLGISFDLTRSFLQPLAWYFLEQT
ncbi:uncharacterized protein LOC142566661 [Dermacentor variabilis]|uniref:uncharacterized protein LOC142566661 n=1 Tax=Dermacentor variabilis TaxID=34621 RepID=UPI003F5C88F0